LPRVLIQIGLLTYRYLFTLSHELNWHALGAAHTGDFVAAPMGVPTGLANMAGMTLVRSLERTDRIYRAMLCRGYTGSLASLQTFSTRPLDRGLSVACLSAVILLLMLDGYCRVW
jgi:cobalt/nickel transport system permease protein